MTNDRRQRTLAAIQRLQGLLVPADIVDTKPAKSRFRPKVGDNRAARRAAKFAPKTGDQRTPPQPGD